VKNITPPLVDSANLIYQVHDGAISAGSAGYDPGGGDLLGRARCDGCKQLSRHCKTYIHASFHAAVGDPETRRHHGRWAFWR